jgi:hypothetical protein
MGGAPSEQHLFSNLSQQAPFSSAADDSLLNIEFLPKDVPPFSFGDVDPFQGFDIPFWLGQDNYAAWMGSGP